MELQMQLSDIEERALAQHVRLELNRYYYFRETPNSYKQRLNSAGQALDLGNHPSQMIGNITLKKYPVKFVVDFLRTACGEEQGRYKFKLFGNGMSICVDTVGPNTEGNRIALAEFDDFVRVVCELNKAGLV